MIENSMRGSATRNRNMVRAMMITRRHQAEKAKRLYFSNTVTHRVRYRPQKALGSNLQL